MTVPLCLFFSSSYKLFGTCQGSMTNCFCFQQGTERGSTWSSCIVIAGQRAPLNCIWNSEFLIPLHFSNSKERHLDSHSVVHLFYLSAFTEVLLGTFFPFASFSFSSELQPGKGKCHPFGDRHKVFPFWE